ncbi:MAG: SAM-dependent methyltransferase [Lachnospiraceae bacterium]|nr:SAM-dependent methyltransferase [Lachnospiraceae bacterium]
MEVRLSKRMQAVADMVQEKRVVDIGCDHAFVSIYLAQKPDIERVIAMDVKTGPVDIAKANIAAYMLADKIDVRMSDGFDKLSVGEADAAVIAGMGGYLMIDILEAGKEHLENGINLVLQPQSDIPEVRRYLDSVGYIIEDEDMLIEDGKYYTIMRAVSRNEKTVEYTADDYNYGPILLKKMHTVLREYLVFSNEKNLTIVEKLRASGSDKSKDRVKQLLDEVDYSKNILDKYFQ